MNLHFTHPMFLLALPVALAWVIWLAWKSDVSLGGWRRWIAFSLRFVIVTLLVLALAGMQWRKAIEGMNVIFLLDRSDSVPSAQQEAAVKYAQTVAMEKKKGDRSGLLVFGANAAIESSPQEIIEPDKQKILAVVSPERTDIAAAVRLGTAAFPENGQKRLVLITDGNENVGEVMSAVLSAKPLDVSIDVIPLGVARGNDVAIQRLGLPGRVKKGQTFDTKIFIQTDRKQTAKLRLYRNDQPLGEQTIEVEPGKNLYTFPQTLADPGFYNYSVQVEVAGDNIPQNNKSAGFTSVRGDPRLLIVSADPQQDAELAAA
ncbi:MAG TPA: VWA domain-containing protein, partial [Candidatus Acidoferrum sp.]|nr:VWA domain-containing protein [Candidatus Acidoferrum sp.]